MATTAQTLSAGGCPCRLRAESRQSPTAAAKWVTEARKGKGKSSALILGGTGHFEVIAPGSPVWSQVEAFLLEQLKVDK